MKRIRIVASLWRMLLMLAVSFLGIEILLIVTDPWLFKGAYQFDPELGFRYRAYHDGSNRFGFNDVDYSLEKPPAIFRLLVLGDSCNWAGGREGNYTALLEQRLEQHYGAHVVDVVNAGYPGTHTGAQLALLKKYGLHYHPDLVVLGFSTGGDFCEADPVRRRIVLNGVLADARGGFNMVLWGRPIVLRSRLVALLQAGWQSLRESMRKRWGAGPQGTLSEERFLDRERTLVTFCNLRRWQAGVLDPRITYSLAGISDIKRMLSEHGIPLIVAIFPDELSANDRFAQQVFSRLQLDPKDYVPDCVHSLLRTYLGTVGVPFIDLVEGFRSEEKDHDLYQFRDGHWNAAGNRLAADLLFERLLEIIEKQRRRNERPSDGEATSQ